MCIRDRDGKIQYGCDFDYEVQRRHMERTREAAWPEQRRRTTVARTIDLEERKQFRVLLNPVRQDIIHLLRRAGRPMTANTCLLYTSSSHSSPWEAAMVRTQLPTIAASHGDEWLDDTVAYQAYQRLACMSNTLADYIRRLGWPARSDAFNNYVTIMPRLVALAGLGLSLIHI